MPRARGPGRNIRRSGTTGRERSSTSRHPYRQPNDAPGSLRRSTRIAEQSQQQSRQAVRGAPMTDVARRAQTTGAPGSRAVETDHSHEPSRHRPQRARGATEPNSASSQEPPMGQRPRLDIERHSSSPEDETPSYTMDVITQPPSTSLPGRNLSPAVTVRLRSLQAETGEEDISHLLAVATLVAEHADRTPEQLQNALAGRRFDSIHPFGADEEGTRGAGYVSFPDLVIRDEGVYRIRVTLIKVRNNSESGSPIPDGGSNVHAVETNPITVGDRTGSGKQDFGLLSPALTHEF